MSFREGAEMMTALPKGKFNPLPSCFKTGQGQEKITLGAQIEPGHLPNRSPAQDFCGWGDFHAGFLLKKTYFFPSWEQEGASSQGKHAWNVTSLFSCLFV